MPRTKPVDKPTEAGEMDVWVTYDNAPEGYYYLELQNGFRGSFWGDKGYSASIMFVDIPSNSLSPGQTKKIRVYTLNPALLTQWLNSERVCWGPLPHPFGTLSLFPPELSHTVNG